MPKPVPVESLLRIPRRARTPVVPALALVGIALFALEIGSASAQGKLLPPEEAFRFSARAWELMARPSLAVHDGVGSHLWYHTRRPEARSSGAAP